MADSKPFLTIISSKAQKEIAASWTWYEERQQGLGDKFAQAVTDVATAIERHPERYPQRYKTYREANIPLFPYLIIYRINRRKKSVRIVSVFHTARNPARKYR